MNEEWTFSIVYAQFVTPWTVTKVSSQTLCFGRSIKHFLKVIMFSMKCSSSAVGLWGFSNWIPHFLFYYAYFTHFVFILCLFLSVLIVISGDVVHSAFWDRYSKISAENPEKSFTQSQYKHEWKCVFCMSLFNNPTKSPNMEKRIHLKLIVLTVLIYTVTSILALMDTFWF